MINLFSKHPLSFCSFIKVHCINLNKLSSKTTKGFIRLIFHCGAKVKERKTNEPLISDPSGVLVWKAAYRVMMKFIDKNDIKAKEEKLKEVIKMWLKVI
ncbi:hypothetical protein ACTHO0_18765 [Cytobacillus praedii]|uniref:hypothetical protein n=1 Tax=Cytobacillus praedii TaxID=1742358 RepID=UPI003F8189A3